MKFSYYINLLIFITFLSDPYIWFKAFTHQYRLINILFISAVSVYILHLIILGKVTWGKKDSKWFASLIIVFLFMVVHGIYFKDTTQIIQSIGYLLKIVFIFNFVYAIKATGRHLLELLYNYNIVMIISAIILFFILITGIDLPSITFSQGLSGMLLDKNWLYPFGVISDRTFFGQFIFSRANGLTDEPGQLALLITWLLVLNELTVKSKNYRTILIVGGLFTFSLGFYFSLVLYALYFFYKKEYLLKVVYAGTLAFIIIIVTYFQLPETLQNIVYYRTLQRLETSNDSDKSFEGDNRSEAISNYFNIVKDEGKLLFGYGFTQSQNKGLPRLFAVYGFGGLIFIYIPILLLLFTRELKLKEKFLILILVINFIQRPGIHFIFQMAVLTMIYYWPLIKFYEPRYSIIKQEHKKKND